eukprot:scaffold19260_cov112-Isochrysis_galbana.AAC.2
MRSRICRSASFIPTVPACSSSNRSHHALCETDGSAAIVRSRGLPAGRGRERSWLVGFFFAWILFFLPAPGAHLSSVPLRISVHRLTKVDLAWPKKAKNASYLRRSDSIHAYPE